MRNWSVWCLIPVYNHAATVTEVALGAARFLPGKVLVADDGSTDWPEHLDALLAAHGIEVHGQAGRRRVEDASDGRTMGLAEEGQAEGRSVGGGHGADSSRPRRAGQPLDTRARTLLHSNPEGPPRASPWVLLALIPDNHSVDARRFP